MEEKEGKRFDLVANKLMLTQMELLQEETKKEETTAKEKVEISQAMATVYRAVLND